MIKTKLKQLGHKVFVNPCTVQFFAVLLAGTEKSVTTTYRFLGKIPALRPVEGQLSVPIIMKISTKNLIHRPSRSIITMGAIAVGTGAIVFLMSFGYGIQTIVNSRLIQPYSMRLADVQSDSTALALTQDTLKEIKKIAGVEDAAAAVSLAGSFSINNSKLDVVVIAADNKYLEYSHIESVHGTLFSKEAEQTFVDVNNEVEELVNLLKEEQSEEVLGVADEKESIKHGDLIHEKTIRYRIKQDIYVPVRELPRVDSTIIGYARGTVLESFSGKEVWGGSYTSIDTSGRYYQAPSGVWYGKWIKTKAPLYEEKFSTEYTPKLGEDGSQLSVEGFIPQVDLHILSHSEIILDRQVEELLQEGNVLGEATDSADLIATQSSTAIDLDNTEASDEAALQQILKQEGEEKQASREAEIAFVNVAKEGGKEIIISTKILNTMELNPKNVIGQEVTLEYIVSGGIIPGVNGRVVSKPVTYTIVGVVQDDQQSLVFTPLADVVSMGVKKFTQAKVLAVDEKSLPGVRERIEIMGFTTQSLVDTLEQVNKLFTVMKFLLGAFGIIALVVAIFGMFNTLTVSLLERTREVGVMKTLGTTDRDISRLFMVESLLIGFLGGIVGIMLGVGGGLFVNVLLKFFQKGVPINLFVAPFSFVLFIFVLSVGIGFVTGLYPAHRAKKISALNALRYE